MRIERQAAANPWFSRDWLIAFTAIVAIGAHPALASDAQESFLLLDESTLTNVRHRLEARDPALLPAMKKLRAEADKALKAGPFSVVDKPFVPPSGDKRDYMSVGPYWWPNPDTDDGLPYVRRDGQTNPERREYDSATMGRMVGAVSSLGLAYHFTGHEPYAEHAARLLRAWFLDERSGMNPHLRYGQAIPGRNQGRYIGIIDTVRLIDLLDPVVMLAPSPHWTDDDMIALRQWFREYNEWLLTSEFGKKERSHPNNHGTWYDAQVTAFALFAGDRETARETVRGVGPRRIAAGIEPDGSQPHELSRTLAFNYSCYNLRALVTLASLGRKVDADLWSFSTDDGRSIGAALRWLAPYAADEEEFAYEQIRRPNLAAAYALFRQAGNAYRDSAYHEIAERIPGTDPADRLNLLHPRHDRM